MPLNVWFSIVTGQTRESDCVPSKNRSITSPYFGDDSSGNAESSSLTNYSHEDQLHQFQQSLKIIHTDRQTHSLGRDAVLVSGATECRELAHTAALHVLN